MRAWGRMIAVLALAAGVQWPAMTVAGEFAGAVAVNQAEVVSRAPAAERERGECASVTAGAERAAAPARTGWELQPLVGKLLLHRLASGH